MQQENLIEYDKCLKHTYFLCSVMTSENLVTLYDFLLSLKNSSAVCWPF